MVRRRLHLVSGRVRWWRPLRRRPLRRRRPVLSCLPSRLQFPVSGADVSWWSGTRDGWALSWPGVRGRVKPSWPVWGKWSGWVEETVVGGSGGSLGDPVRSVTTAGKSLILWSGGVELDAGLDMRSKHPRHVQGRSARSSSLRSCLVRSVQRRWCHSRQSEQRTESLPTLMRQPPHRKVTGAELRLQGWTVSTVACVMCLGGELLCRASMIGGLFAACRYLRRRVAGAAICGEGMPSLGEVSGGGADVVATAMLFAWHLPHLHAFPVLIWRRRSCIVRSVQRRWCQRLQLLHWIALHPTFPLQAPHGQGPGFFSMSPALNNNRANWAELSRSAAEKSNVLDLGDCTRGGYVWRSTLLSLLGGRGAIPSWRGSNAVTAFDTVR